ncbi:Metallopeptidase domain-containing protein OS=Cellulomonas persica OX=76861 GN=CPE01_30480 PE=4 SV=1 [Cellulomonas persica]
MPGLDIVTSALAMVSGVTDVATSGMRQHETDNAMFEARAGSTDQVNVMVYPLMKVSQVYTKQLEQSCWTLGASVLDFSLSVAQVASAGGFGIPAAIKASAAVVDKLHSLAHYIADKVLATQAKRAQKESAVLHLEGAAEDELKKHPKMAVDGIVMRAAQGDAVALAFLANYRIDGKPITRDYVAQIKPKPRKPVDPKAPETDDLTSTSNDALLLRIRETVLAGMNVEADPQGVFDDLKAQLDQVTGKGASLRDGWREAGELRQQRNALAGQGKLGANTKGDRGIFWQLRMTLSSEKRGMLKARTEVYEGVEALPTGVACAVGSHELPENATDAQCEAFLDGLTVKDLEAELARTPRRNSPGWIAFLRDALREKKTGGSSSTTPAPAPTAPAQP